MGESVNFTYLIILVAVCTLWFLLDYFYAPKHVPNEPPVVTQTIPYVGHIIGLLRHGLKYYEMTRYTINRSAREGIKANQGQWIVRGANRPFTLCTC